MNAVAVCETCGNRLLGTSAETGECVYCLLHLASDPLDSEPAAPAILSRETAGRRIGPYTLLEVIGEGGFGTVWLAEQVEPVRRRVALKIIKLGMDTRAFVARFEGERQALAMMNHPNIARVIDAGATEEGRPYLVMELVDGPAITHYCDAQALTLSARLSLFVRVCQAVQHAHHKGVIHRDLKPSNILVAEIEAQPFPKIIDFGVSKATQEPLTDNLLLTQSHQVLGTPAYMSPEQTGVGGLDIDARADVYALGVLLYELLTGETPLASQAQPDAGHEALLRVIREVEPTRPSARVRSMALDDLRRVAKCRAERPDRLPRLVEGDLDWIALKALEKDRDRRYPSASALAEDVLRHLAGEPVAARPPANLYRFGKWIGRHRLGFAAASTVLAALIVGLVVALAQAIRAARAEEEIRHRAYAAEVNLAQQVLRENNLERALELLNRQTPVAGETDLRGFEWRHLWQQCQGMESVSFPDGNVEAMAYSPDGKFLASASTNILIRDADSHRVLTNLSMAPLTLAFSHDGTLLVAGAHQEVAVWETRNWQRRPKLPAASFPTLFSPDGRWLVTGQPSTNQLLVWNTSTWEASPGGYGSPDLPPNARHGFAFSPDGTLLVTPWIHMGRSQFGLRVWRFPAFEGITDLFPAETPLFSAAFLPDGKHLLAGTFDGRLLVWNVEKREFVETHREHSAHITSIAVQGRQFVTASSDRTLSLWDSETRRHLARLRGHTREVWSVAFSPSADGVASGAFDGTARIWNTPVAAHHTLEGGGLIAGSTRDSRGFVFGPHTGDYHWRFSDGQTRPIPVPAKPPVITTTFTRPVDVQGEPPLGAMARADGSLEIWDLGAGVISASKPVSTSEITVVTFSSDARQIATGDILGNIGVWSVKDLRSSMMIRPVPDRVTALAFTPDGRILATASGWEGRVVLWDLATGQPVRHLQTTDATTWIDFSPDGQRMAASSMASNEVRIWETRTGHLQAILRGHVMGVLRVQFSPDGKSLATGAFDGKVKLWSLAALQEVLTLSAPEGAIFRSLCFAPDNGALALGFLESAPFDAPSPAHQAILFTAPSIEQITTAERRRVHPLPPHSTPP